MNKIKLNHWFLNDNELTISLMRFFVKIQILMNDEFIYYQLVVKSEDDFLTFNFYSLEDAVCFCEKVISLCKNKDEIVDKYKELFNNCEFKNPYLNKENLYLNQDELYDIIIKYYSDDNSMSVKEVLEINNDSLDFKFYLVKDENTILLSDDDIRIILSSYASSINCKLIDFKYIGGIHRVGYFFDEDTSHFDGVKLSLCKTQK